MKINHKKRRERRFFLLFVFFVSSWFLFSEEDVLRLVIRQEMTLAIIGLAIGLIASFALTRTMRSLLFDTSASDPLVFAAIAVLLTGVALLACWIPARREAGSDGSSPPRMIS
jgi:hypothetical protein